MGLRAAGQLPGDGRLLAGGGRLVAGPPLRQRVDGLAVGRPGRETVAAVDPVARARAGQVRPGGHRAVRTGVGGRAGAVARCRVERPTAQGDLVAGLAGAGAVAQRGQRAEDRRGPVVLRAGRGQGRRLLHPAGERAGHQHRGGQGHVGDRAAVGAGAQLDANAVPRRQAGDHDQAHHPGDGHVHLRRRRELFVELVQLLAADADAAVLHVQRGAVTDPTGLDHDLRVRRGERGGVVEQLGDEVHQVVDRVRGDLDVAVDDPELDAGVVLDLGLRGAQHVDERSRLALHARGVGAREDEQVLVVAAHPGGQVVELEQLGQPVRVLLAALQPVEVPDEAVDQDLRTAGQVDEHRRDGGAQCRLLGGRPDGFQVDGVERLGHLAELVLAADGQRLGDLVGQLHRGELPDDLRVAESGHRLRQPVLGDGEGALAQLTQRAGHRAGDQVREEDGQQQHAEQQAGLQEHLALDVRPEVVGLGDHVTVELRLDGADQLGVGRHGRFPLVGAERGVAHVACGVAVDPAGVVLRLAPVAAGDGLVVELRLVGAGYRLEALQRLLLAGAAGDVVGAQRRGQSAPTLHAERAVHDDPSERQELLLPGDRCRGPHPVAELVVAGELGGRVPDGEQVVDQTLVRLDGLGELQLAVEHLTADARQLLQVLVDAAEQALKAARQVLHVAPLLPVGARRLVDPGVRPVVGLLVLRLRLRPGGLQQQHGGGPLVLEFVDQVTRIARQVGQVAGSVGIVERLQVVDETTGTHHDRGDGRHDHDETELGPDRHVPEPAGRPAQPRQEGARRLWPFAHVTALAITA
ncbi:hypothetical protein B0E54_03602 [Micromonospora sp. MH99]|nr:hypothetical protein [Micromonospora sp. MH99]